MPQPVRVIQGTATAKPKVVLDRPKLAALIGALAAEWGFIDRTLADTFNLIGFAKPVPVGAHATDPLAAAVFDALISLPTRLAALQAVVKLRLPDAEVEDFEKIAKELRRRAIERAEYIHSSWNISSDYPDDLIVIQPDGTWVRYTEKCFHAALDRTLAIRGRLIDFCVRTAGMPKKEVTSR